MPNINYSTVIPNAHVPIVGMTNMTCTREWYRFLFNMYNLTGSNGNLISIDDIQLAPLSINP